MQSGDQVYIDGPAWRVQRPENKTTDPLTGCSKNLENTVTKGSRRLLSRTTGPYIVQSVTESTVIIDKDEVITPVRVNRVTKMSRVRNSTEPAAVLDNTTGQSELAMQRNGEKNNSSPAVPGDPKPAEFAIHRLVGHRGTRDQIEYKSPIKRIQCRRPYL